MEEYLADKPMEEPMEDGGAAVTQEQTAPEQEQTETPQREQAEEEADGAKESEGAEETPAGAENTGRQSEQTVPLEKTREFSRRLRESTQKARDRVYESFGWVNPYTGQKILNERGYQEYLRMKKAEELGRDPVAEKRILALEEANRRTQALALEMKNRQADQALQNDPVYGGIYKTLREEVQQLMEACRQQGYAGVTVQSAFSALLGNRDVMQRILEQAKEKGAKEATRRIRANGKAQVGSISESQPAPKVDFTKMSSKEFEKVLHDVKSGKKIKL